MNKMDIYLKSEDEAVKLVSQLSDFQGDVDLVYGHYTVDAKSILGVLSVAVGRIVSLRLLSGKLEELEEKIGRCIVANS